MAAGGREAQPKPNVKLPARESFRSLDPTPVSDPPGFRPEFEMRFRSVRVQRLPRFAIDRHASEVPFL
jgi:hypothetical protein